MFGFLKKKAAPIEPKATFPPTPDWKPSIAQPVSVLVERLRHYTNGTRDFAVFTHGTLAILPSGLETIEAEMYAKEALRQVFHAHPDMQPLLMDDGNVLVRYNHDVANIVLDSVVVQNWNEITSQHQRALARDEVLITPLGENTFDDFGMKALFGRCFMFMDAQAPEVLRIERHIAWVER